jgi:uncharacterized membrane protein
LLTTLVAPHPKGAAVPTSAITDIVIGVVVVGLLVARQTQTRPVRENSAARIVLILAVIGIIELVNATKGRTVGAPTVAWIVGSLIIGGVLGAVRALSVKIWRTPDGPALRKGTVATVVLWVVSLGAHLAMEVGIDDSTKIAGLGASTLFLYLALTLGAQLEVVRWRAARLAPGAS